MGTHAKLIEVVAQRGFKDSRGRHVKPGEHAFLHTRAASAAVSAGRAYYIKVTRAAENKGSAPQPRPKPATDMPLPKLREPEREPLPDNLDDITGHKASNAKNLISRCEVVSVLEQWARDELANKKRKSVLMAIARRLQTLTASVDGGD